LVPGFMLAILYRLLVLEPRPVIESPGLRLDHRGQNDRGRA